jgi:Cft2 family RNA processing exonuclease
VGDLHLTLFPAGHILGAVGVVIEGGGHKIVVTGDISGVDDHYLSVETARLPEGLVAGADLLVIETTYCGSEHRPRQEQERGLVETVSSVVEHRGRVLIPAFGLGRAQEVVMILTQRLPDVDILVDGLAKDVTRIYEVIAKDAGRSLSILGGHVQPVMIRSRQLRSFTSGVIVASSGMLTGGPSVAWAKEILPDPKAALLLCGYQDEEAPGRRLEHLADGRQEPTLRLPDEGEWVDVPVHARVYKYGLSAHADRAGLIDIIERIRPQNTMLVHGYPEKQEPFRTELHRKQIPTVPTQRWSSCPS